MSDAPDPHEGPSLSFGRAFAIGFGVCALPPLLLYASTQASGSSSDSAMLFGLLPAVLGFGVLIVGLVRMASGRAGAGGLVLGALAGFVVGFSLCLGSFTLDTK